MGQGYKASMTKPFPLYPVCGWLGLLEKSSDERSSQWGLCLWLAINTCENSHYPSSVAVLGRGLIGLCAQSANSSAMMQRGFTAALVSVNRAKTLVNFTGSKFAPPGQMCYTMKILSGMRQRKCMSRTRNARPEKL